MLQTHFPHNIVLNTHYARGSVSSQLVPMCCPDMVEGSSQAGNNGKAKFLGHSNPYTKLICAIARKLTS